MPVLPSASLPDCPPHLNEGAREEWYRLVDTLVEMGVVTVVDRAALAAYCQAWARWVEAEEKLAETPVLLKTPSGYVQQSPWLSIANKQLVLMGRYMAELGLTPASRSRVGIAAAPDPLPSRVEVILVGVNPDGTRTETPIGGKGQGFESMAVEGETRRIELDARL